MKIMLTAINSKYIHTNLAIRYLYQSLKKLDEEILLKEYTINQHLDDLLKSIYEEQPDVIGFSCYIWNISLVHQLGRELKKVLPDTRIILGGPEVGFDTREIMEQEDYIDMIVKGEGEAVFYDLLKRIKADESYHDIENIAFRVRGRIIENPSKSSNTFHDHAPFPYDGLRIDPNKIYYYESARGCPYNCEYCLSSAISGVSFLAMEKIHRELDFFLRNNVKQVKFVDRTFNANKKHALEIMKYLLKNNNHHTNFHFEITAELIDDDIIEFLKTVPKGLFQFEVGVQSTNPETLSAINRRMSFDSIKSALEALVKLDNIHIHLDLIAGLPYEDYFTFRKSFNEVFSLRADKLQLGFLKLLKGSALRRKSEDYGYVHTEGPPYEILENFWINYTEILKLKDVENLLEKYWNDHGFPRTLDYVINTRYQANAFKFFEDFSGYWKDKGLNEQSQSKESLYVILFEFCKNRNFEETLYIQNLLRFDYLKENGKRKIPKALEAKSKEDQEKIWSKEEAHEFLQNRENRERFLPDSLDTSTKKLIKKVHFEVFEYPITEKLEYDLGTIPKERDCVILFDYEQDRAYLIK